MAVEILGRWQDTRSHDGSRHRDMLRNREETQETSHVGLPVRELSISQLVGIQVLHL